MAAEAKELRITNGTQTPNEQWEEPLEKSEYPRLQELGLGVAVNITEKHPWVKKSAFQAKPVGFKWPVSDLIVINESNQFKKYSEVVESFSEVQSALESSFRPSPNQPIDVSIAADFHRSLTNKKSMKGETVLTRTIAFRVFDPVTRAENKEEFEIQLNKWLKKMGCIKNSKDNDDQKIPAECKIPKQGTEEASTPQQSDGKGDACDKIEEASTPQQSDGKGDACEKIEEASTPQQRDGKGDSFEYYTPETNHYCIKYIRALGGVTHYVSSVTLGATRYHVETEKLINLSLSQSAGVSVDRFASSTVKSRAKKRKFVSSSKTEAIGRVPPYDKSGNLTDILQFRSMREAVVRCSFTSLSNLVTHPHLQKEVEAAIQEYIDFQLRGTRGPYLIATTEELPLGQEKPQTANATGQPLRGRIYWMVVHDPPKDGEDPIKNGKDRSTGGGADRSTGGGADHSTGGGADRSTGGGADRSTGGGADRSTGGGEDRSTGGGADRSTGGGADRSTGGNKGRSGYIVACTSQSKHATNFYLKPFEGKYFLIATDPEDPCMGAGRRASRNSQSDRAYTRAPQRYVHVTKGKLSARMVIDKKTAVFKLKSPHAYDRKKSHYPLSKSQWLPESTLGTQPYYILRKGSSFSSTKSKILTVEKDEKKEKDEKEKDKKKEEDEKEKDKKKEKDEKEKKDEKEDIPIYGTIAHKPGEDISNQLFILEPGHPT